MINYGNCLHQADVNTLTCCYVNIHLAIFHQRIKYIGFICLSECQLTLEDKVTSVSMYLACNSFISIAFLRPTLFLAAFL